MKNIFTIPQAVNLSKKLREQNKKIVICGGCFDILHIGHIALLKGAKEKGDSLFVLLESDEKIKQLKGENRPIHTQQERAEILASLRFVDYVICLPLYNTNEEYDQLITFLHPDIIATTENDPATVHKKRQAGIVNAKLISVTKYIPNKSTSSLLAILEKEK